jgi:hypothetical protein
MTDAPGGYALLETFYDESASAFSYRLTANDGTATRVLWEAEGMGWELAGRSAVPVNAGLSAFPAQA